ncbi:carboxylesterase/lipase family protein [Brevundimonas sp.]|uniref:carboxylesterase/lipase family protein n=1 Tax=Brevundimonas sp. TaxID=1871086 RepID=UPI0035AF726C
MTFVGAFATLALMAGQVDTQQHAEARLSQGVLAGRVEDTVASYRNIPYAAPPVGPLRWRPPQPPTAWTGRRDATAYGAICIQPPANGDPGVGPPPMSEDCLNLNVWTTQQTGARAPVMVWIHGGALINGSGTAALYEGDDLARRGVVVVTLNYRLGRLGFFDHPALAAERPAEEAAGNYGVMDVIAALEWVKANIAAFGGDPANVTVFGESAGGVLVNRLMISPKARGLFHKAVVQSGLGRELQIPLDRKGPGGSPSARERGQAWGAAAGLTTAEALRAAPPETFLGPAPSFANGDLNLIDGVVVPDRVEAVFRAGGQAPVPYVIGTNSAEFWWIKPTDRSGYGLIDDDMTWLERAEAVQAYGGIQGFDAQVVTDLVFTEPARNLARLHAAAGHPTYLYRFDVTSTAGPEPHNGASHAVERPYVFGNLGILPYPVEERDRRASEAMMGYWTAFARSGDPDGPGRPAWPRVTGNDQRIMTFGNEGPFVAPAPFSARLDILQRFRERGRP